MKQKNLRHLVPSIALLMRHLDSWRCQLFARVENFPSQTSSCLFHSHWISLSFPHHQQQTLHYWSTVWFFPPFPPTSLQKTHERCENHDNTSLPFRVLVENQLKFNFFTTFFHCSFVQTCWKRIKNCRKEKTDKRKALLNLSETSIKSSPAAAAFAWRVRCHPGIIN